MTCTDGIFGTRSGEDQPVTPPPGDHQCRSDTDQ
jgi:hypothetical protein